MAVTDPKILEMPADPTLGAMPWYRHIVDWASAETLGLSDEQLDFHDSSPEKEWMWWSCRRQVSHIAWDSLVFTKRRAGHFLWPEGDVPQPIDWREHQMGPENKWDRVLDETLFWELPELFAHLQLGVGWLDQVVQEQPIEVLRSDFRTVRGTDFW
ncbi:MAG: hypothetical protein NZ659_00030, partial [Acidimicrobiales bacterium]|nr:hypothetical protein [Acidimicrobiales bacterium]